ncbi:MAG TPA: tRNA pseudouridine(13) synthase TruD [Gammaproteobacteria bacterium]|jgi:tRNA pseudouridine13 synthase
MNDPGFPLPDGLQLDWAFALGEPRCRGAIRSVPEDFIVEEEIGFFPDGEGHHAWLHIRKRNTNTEWLARELATLADVPLGEVGYAGLKDRHAVTSQVFTVNLSGKAEPDWQQLASDDIAFLEIDRHGRKLKRGALRENRFILTLRELAGECDDLEQRLQRIAADGVPNYFGEQRFGHGFGNLAMAAAMFRGEWRESVRHKRSLYLSAARSYLFNKVLSARVADGSWHRALPGESLMQEGSTSCFTVRLIGSDIEKRIAAGQLHPTGPLWGRGRPTSLAEALAFELETLAGEDFWKAGLEKAGMEQERRALRLPVRKLQWQWLDAATLQLQFALPPGAYATSLLREIAKTGSAASYG